MSHLVISLLGPFQVTRDLHLAFYHEGQGEYVQALAYARRLLELEPWRESAHRQCMRALTALGQRGAALVRYRTCRQVWAKQLGVEPELETQVLYDRIRVGVRSQSTSVRSGSGLRRL